MAAVIKKVNPICAILIGHSMGGYVIFETARMLPSKVIALVGADSWADFGDTTTTGWTEFLEGFRQDFRKNTISFAKGLFGEHADTFLSGRISRDMASGPREVGISSITNMFHYNLSQALAPLKIPIFGINCDKFPVNEKRNKIMYRRYKLILMPGVGHFVQLEDPVRFNQLLDEVIKIDLAKHP